MAGQRRGKDGVLCEVVWDTRMPTHTRSNSRIASSLLASSLENFRLLASLDAPSTLMAKRQRTERRTPDNDGSHYDDAMTSILRQSAIALLDGRHQDTPRKKDRIGSASLALCTNSLDSPPAAAKTDFLVLKEQGEAMPLP